jgi:hypothetical protein
VDHPCPRDRGNGPDRLPARRPRRSKTSPIPFCSASRPTNANSGRGGRHDRVGRRAPPSPRYLPSTTSAPPYGLGRWESLPRIPGCRVDPVDDSSQRITASESTPRDCIPGADWISRVCAVGLTVLTMSANTIPVLRRFNWPNYSICCQLKYRQSIPVRSMSQCQNTP